MAQHFQEFLPEKTTKYGPQIERQNTVCSVEKFTQVLKV